MLNLALTIAQTLLTLMVTVSGNPNPTYPTNPTTKYRCESVNLNCIYTPICMDSSALVPKCLGSEVTWVRSVLTPCVTGLQHVTSVPNADSEIMPPRNPLYYPVTSQ